MGMKRHECVRMHMQAHVCANASVETSQSNLTRFFVASPKTLVDSSDSLRFRTDFLKLWNFYPWNLGHAVALHLVCGAVLCLDIALLHLICNKEVADVNVPRPLTHALVPILFQFDGTGVVLWDCVSVCFTALSLEKMLGPWDLGHAVIDWNEFCLCGAPRV